MIFPSEEPNPGQLNKPQSCIEVVQIEEKVVLHCSECRMNESVS